MFLILLEYKQPLDVIDRFVVAHREHLDHQYAAGRLVISGPQVPRTGGLLIARGDTRADIEAMMQSDPFTMADLINYRIVEFRVTAAQQGLGDALAALGCG